MKIPPEFELPPITKGFGDRLRQARIAAGYDTQPALAAAMHVNVNTISRLESGRHLPTLDTIYHLSRVLGVSVLHLQHDTSTPAVVTRYLESAHSRGLLPEARAQLSKVPWVFLVIGEPSLYEVETLAMVIDRGFRKRAAS